MKRKANNRLAYLLAVVLVMLLLAVFLIVLAVNLSSKKETPTTTIKTTVQTVSSTTADVWAPFRAVPYFVESKFDRYQTFSKNNPALSPEEVILRVNMEMDRSFYTDPIAIQNPDSLLVLCNKYYYLPSNYTPTDLVNVPAKRTRSGAKLRAEANEAFNALCDAAEKDGIAIKITTSFRDYKFQKTLYDGYVRKDGVEAADLYSARPGFSEHQTGLAMDLGGKTASGTWDLSAFEKSEAFSWMQSHAGEYGFILRFPADKEDVTGYEYEPWHYRYVGKEAASVIWSEGLCLEEYIAKYQSTTVN